MLKNYTSEGKNTFEKITKILTSHKAQQIIFDYAEDGSIKSLSFTLKISDTVHGFTLPARVEKVEQIFFETKKKKARYSYGLQLSDAEKLQAYRTAWANIRDWLDAQMALIDTEQVKIEEVFLPYMRNRRGETFFEVMNNRNFDLPQLPGLSTPVEGEVISE